MANFVLLLVAVAAIYAPLASAQVYQQLHPVMGGLHPSQVTQLHSTQLEDRQNKLGDIGDLLLTIRNQIKEAIREVIGQIVENLKALFESFRLKLFRKLGKLTISDIFRSIFGGVSDFVQADSPVYASQKPAVSFERPSSLFGNQEYWQR